MYLEEMDISELSELEQQAIREGCTEIARLRADLARVTTDRDAQAKHHCELVDAMRAAIARAEAAEKCAQEAEARAEHWRAEAERDEAIQRNACGVWCPRCKGLVFVDDECVCRTCGEEGTEPVADMARTLDEIAETIDRTDLYEIHELVAHVRSVVEERDARPAITPEDAAQLVMSESDGTIYGGKVRMKRIIRAIRAHAAKAAPAQGYVHATTPPGPGHAKAATASDEGEACPAVRDTMWEGYGVIGRSPASKLPRDVVMTPEQREEQRRSFAYGNVAIENPSVTREDVDRAAEAMKPAPVSDKSRPCSCDDVCWRCAPASDEGEVYASEPLCVTVAEFRTDRDAVARAAFDEHREVVIVGSGGTEIGTLKVYGGTGRTGAKGGE